ncbi:OmpA family protein [Mongoliitalea daihaiensis]|uniref:OmpA family protein n=1 Tax=Mongoliitalea daihaiensis TaxID=2782006 RepID=UPI001F317870|nr:OmpA family protein [Mongoliitalea daihaiensis]UJP65742.1 OmpA family protein [Mongoliitalea daihaiensis]
MVLIMRSKTTYIKFLAALLLFMYTITAEAQRPLLRFADKQFELENYAHAAQVYGEAYARKETYETARKLAVTYQTLRDYDKAFEWWGKTVAYEESNKDDFYLYLMAAMQAGEAEDLNAFLTAGGYSSFDFPGLDLETLEKLYGERKNVKLVQPKGINSSGSDFGLSRHEDSQYFSSDRGGVSSSKRKAIRLDAKNNLFSDEKSNFNEREYYRLYVKEGSEEAKPIVIDLEGVQHVSDVHVYGEGSKIMYTAFVGQTKVGSRKQSMKLTNFPGIFYGNLQADGTVSDSKPFPHNSMLEYGMMNAFYDAQSGRLYFASNREGGYGGYDIYYVEYDGVDTFGEPVNLGSGINTMESESHPSRVGDWFYFSSRGHVGLGGMDIFRAPYSAASIGTPENMGVPFNSPRDDFAYVEFSDGKRYLSSDREGGMGLDDIYLVEDLHKRLIARVIDCDGNIIAEEFDADLRQKGGDQLNTKRGATGELLADLEPEKEFGLVISKKGYFTITDNTLSTVNLKEEKLEREYRLAAIPYQTPVYVDIVYYDLDRSKIRKDAQEALDKIAELMNRYSFLDLLVGSHTDSRASRAYNEALSQRRADAVKDYLAGYNIGAERIRLEWYGEEVLTNDCGDGVPCPEPAHQLNRRSELVLEAFPDKDKQYELPKELMGKDLCDINGLFDSLRNELNSLPTIYFDFDKNTLRSVHKKELERTAIMLNRMKNLQLSIAGHTDQRGSEEYNKGLSERRAQVVMDYLVNRGVDAARMQYQWFGKTQPVNDCGAIPCTEAMHQLNRRTELRLGGVN